MQDATQTRSLRQRWEAYQLTKTQAFWLSAGSVIATLIVGFGFGGWVTAGTAAETTEEAKATARHALATAICVEEFMQAADAGSRLKQLKDASWYERDDILAASGWATMPDRKEPNIVVADMCATKLAELPPTGGTL